MSLGSIHLGTREPFGYSEGERRVPFSTLPSTYVIGASGSGKTHLLRNILIQMIARGDGVGILDPHGDVSEELLVDIPPERTRDVCYFNPADLSYPVAWNPLASVPKDRQARVVEDIVAAFKNLFGKGWGYQTEHILSNTIAVLIAAKNTSLLGIRRVLIDADYRAPAQASHRPHGTQFLARRVRGMGAKFRLAAIARCKTKSALFRNPIARNILGQVQNRLDIRADRQPIDIHCAYPKALARTTLLGALLMTQFQQAALERANIPEKRVCPFISLLMNSKAF